MGEIRGIKLVSIVILIKGILNTLLGVLHVVGTFTFEATTISGQGPVEMQRDYLIWYCGVGVFILFMGLVDIISYKSLQVGMKLAWRISLLCALFTTLLGLFGVIVFGISPPLQLLVTGIAGIVMLVFSKREFLAL